MRRRGAYRGAYSGPYGPDAAYGGSYSGTFSPGLLRPYSWYDAELGQPKNVGYVQLGGSSGDNIQTPDSTALSFSNDIEVVMRVRVTDWSTGSGQTLCGKYVSTGNQRSWRFYVSSTGSIGLSVSQDGTSSVTTVTVTPTVALADDAWVWLRMRLDLSNGTNSVGTLETAADTGDNVEPASWTANGTNTGTTIATVFDSTAVLEIGAFAAGTLERLAGRVGRCIVRNGFGGTTVADFNASDCYGDGYTHTDGYRWTLGLPKIYDRSGNNHPPAVFGSGSNQPKWLPWDGTPSVYLTGASGNYVSCPDAAPLRITGDLEIVARIDPVLGVTQRILSKDDLAAQRSYGMDVKASGELGVIVRVAAATVSAQSSAATQGIPQWVKVTRESSSGVTKFYTAPDQPVEPVSWTQLGADVAATSGLIDVSTARPTIGAISASGSFPFSGRVYRAIVRNGIDGTTVADFDASLCGQSGYTDAQGNPWTVDRGTAGRKSVVQSPAARSARSVILFGTDDWIVVPASAVPSLAPSASAAVALAIRQHATPTSNGTYFSNKVTTDAPTGKGVALYAAGATHAIGASVGDGTNGADAGSPTYTAGTRVLCSMGIATRTSSLLRVNGATPAAMAAIASVGDATNATDGVIGRRGSSVAGYQDFEFEAFLTRSAEIGDVDHGRLVAYYGGGL